MLLDIYRFLSGCYLEGDRSELELLAAWLFSSGFWMRLLRSVSGGVPAGTGLGFESFGFVFNLFFFLARNWQFVSVSPRFAWSEREVETQNVRREVQERFGALPLPLAMALGTSPWGLIASIKKQGLRIS